MSAPSVPDAAGAPETPQSAATLPDPVEPGVSEERPSGRVIRGSRRGPMTALILMRMGALQRTGRSLAPVIGALVVLAVLYGGGQARPAEAYGVSAVLLFPVFAWQSKILLDVEPDVQRRLALVALRSRRKEVLAGLIAAALSTTPVIAAALVMPWLFGALTLDHGGPGFIASLLLGLWAHVLVVPPAVAVGAWCSRVVAGNAGRSVTLLAAVVVLVMLLGLKSSPVPWLGPPLLASARTLTADKLDWVALGPLTAWALLWSALVFAGYGWMRRSRA